MVIRDSMDDFTSSLAEDNDMLGVFLEEAYDQLQVLDIGLVQLEQDPGNAEGIKSVFRVAHTLKSSSAMMGLITMSELTHAMEDVLDEVRHDSLLIDARVIDLLLRGLDLLRSMVQAVEGKGPLDAFDAQIHELCGELRSSASGAAGAHVAIASEDVDVLECDDSAVAVLVQFAESCQLPDIRALMVLRSLGESGDLVSCTPTLDDIEQQRVGRRLLAVVATDSLEAELRHAVMKVGEVEWVHLARGAEADGLTLDSPSPAGPVELTPSTPAAPQPQHPTPVAQIPNAASTASAPNTVRVRVDTLDHLMNLVGELVLDRTRIAQLMDSLGASRADEAVVQELGVVAHHLGSVVTDIHEDVLQARMLPIRELFRRFPRLVRDLSHSLGKEIELRVDGEEELLDRSVIEKLVDPLTHILRNSVDHGMESREERAETGKPARGTIQLSARRSESHLLIKVADDGPGINVERLKDKAVEAGHITPAQAGVLSLREAHNLIFIPGLSSAKMVSDISGRGVGMDVVKKAIETLGGTIQVESEAGFGSSFLLTIPLTLAIIRALIVRTGDVEFALPLSTVEETISLARSRIKTVRGRGVLPWRDRVVPVVPLSDIFPGCGTGEDRPMVPLVAVRYGDQAACLAVDAILGHQEIVVKSLSGYLGQTRGLAGATILGSGRVALIIDLGKVFEDDVLQAGIKGTAGTCD